jgi:hypothetical protein
LVACHGVVVSVLAADLRCLLVPCLITIGRWAGIAGFVWVPVAWFFLRRGGLGGLSVGVRTGALADGVCVGVEEVFGVPVVVEAVLAGVE